LLHSLKLRCLAHRWSFSPLETLRCRPSSFQKLTLFSQKNIVLYPPSSNTDSFFKNIYSAPSIHLKAAILPKYDVPHTLKPWEICSIPAT
jgi:hypothetical protein